MNYHISLRFQQPMAFLKEAVQGRIVHMLHHMHSSKTYSSPVGRGFDNDRCLFCTPPAFVSSDSATEKRVIHLDNSSQLVGRITLFHSPADLM